MTRLASGIILRAEQVALGYGLKLPNDFRDAHLGRIGKI